jgi:hypothetical protein
VVLLVTLEKGDMATGFQYGDHFLSKDVFQWQSQDRTLRDGKHGLLIRDHAARGVAVQLFVKAKKRRARGGSAPFVYCGSVRFLAWEGEARITVRWALSESIPPRLGKELQVPE